MTTSDYSLAWILPFVRQALRERGNFSYDNFVTAVWRELERVKVPGVVRPPPGEYAPYPYNFSKAPYELHRVTTEAFYYLFHNGFTIPEPPKDAPWSPNQNRFYLTPRGLEWAASIEPLPEDVDGYMKFTGHLAVAFGNYVILNHAEWAGAGQLDQWPGACVQWCFPHSSKAPP
jgi:hypothetical protein